jgi:hypothetical protein
VTIPAAAPIAKAVVTKNNFFMGLSPCVDPAFHRIRVWKRDRKLSVRRGVWKVSKAAS